jgi:pimeloyl-ACP methyl ester carboxylesterase
MTTRRALVAIGLVAAAAVAIFVALTWPRATPSVAVPTVIRQEPCPESRFTCITLRVPRDHFGPAGGPTFDVTFGLLRATESPRKGVWVTITGGPGTAGLSSGDSYLDAFDPRISEQYDIVFLDQRGVGLSEPLQCPNAAVAFYTTPAIPTSSAADAEAFAAAASRFADDCVTESGVDPSDLPYFSTRQAVEDLEAFRVWLKADKIDLYGESYGTQYVQTYAAAHPDRLHSLFIDGAVDLTLSGVDFYAESARAYDEALALTLDRCTDDPGCRADVGGGDALSTYDALAARLRDQPMQYNFVDADGEVQQRDFSLGDLETAAAGYITSTFDRMLLQRAIAQASRGKLLPLARLAYLALGQDPESLDAIPDPTYSDALYYAVECMDYAFGSGAAPQRADAFLAAGAAARVADHRLGSVFYGDLPCAYWLTHPADEDRPPYLGNTGYPVFVLTSTTDPATPHAGALRIYDQLDDGYLITTPGGPHVIFGRGEPCPDELVAAFLVEGELPADRSTECPFLGTDPYAPIPAASVGDYEITVAAMTAIDHEIYYSGDWWEWDGSEVLTFGCLHGGAISYEASAQGYVVALIDCAFSAGLPLTGEGSINDDGSFSLSVSTIGDEALTYDRDPDGVQSATGTLPE